MRRGGVIFAICCITTVIFLVLSVWTPLTLLTASGIEDAIQPHELTTPGQQLIPKIIHQTYKNTSIPQVWADAQRSCLALHQEWEYKFWTDVSSEQFISDEYPWFLDTFLGYEHNIQRADAIRYFVLAHFGGVYIDLDDGCNRSLEPLLQFPAWVRKTTPTGISNDVMGAVAGHPYFTRVMKELQNYDQSWFSPYITVMVATGPLFLSLIWRHWTMEGLNVDAGRVRILFKDDYMGQPTSFFVHHLGNSWHESDVHVITWLHQNWMMITIVCTLVGLGALLGAWKLCERYAQAFDHQRPRRRSPSLLLPVWVQYSEQVYEKVNRHDV